MIKVTPFIYEDLDDLYANTYLLTDKDNNAVVIDPSKPNTSITDYVRKHNLNLKGILLTHGHIDHIRGVDAIVSVMPVPVYIGFFDANKLQDPHENCSFLFEKEETIDAKAETVSEGEVLNLLNEEITVIEVPYHTSGSVCYYLKDSGLLFVGDFILEHSVGRCDLPTAMPREFRKSMSKIVSLPKETKIYSGHGKKSTIEEELSSNPFVK